MFVFDKSTLNNDDHYLSHDKFIILIAIMHLQSAVFQWFQSVAALVNTSFSLLVNFEKRLKMSPCDGQNLSDDELSERRPVTNSKKLSLTQLTLFLYRLR